MPIRRSEPLPILVDQAALNHLPKIGLGGLGLYVLLLADEEAQRVRNESTLEKHLNELMISKEVLIACLRELAESGLFEIVEDGEPLWRQHVEREVQPRVELESRPNPGYVYVIDGGHFYYKIGKAQDPKRRLVQLQRSAPTLLHIVHLIPTDHMTMLEGLLHTRFADCRRHGEWFELTPEDIAWIKEDFPGE